MAMFEGMMRQVTEKQDAMQRVFLETLEKWEAERTEREEAWRRKEVARINREREQLSKERAAAASRDAALIAFLQRVGGAGGEPVRLSPSSAGATRHDAAAAGLQLVPVPAPRAKAEDAWAAAGGDGSGTTAPSRWPKEEVQALIDLRMEKEEQYNDMGPKGPLWEEIAAGMQRIGYNRSAKRCKEKWENINKYFKKVKESNKRRPEDSKTCPYFHQLDAIYRKKHFAGRGGGGGGVTIAASHSSLAIVTVSEQDNPSQRELEGKSSNDVGNVQLAVPLLVHNAPDKVNHLIQVSLSFKLIARELIKFVSCTEGGRLRRRTKCHSSSGGDGQRRDVWRIHRRWRRRRQNAVQNRVPEANCGRRRRRQRRTRAGDNCGSDEFSPNQQHQLPCGSVGGSARRVRGLKKARQASPSSFSVQEGHNCPIILFQLFCCDVGNIPYTIC
ncbi:Os02g0648300 [Oryza sativa Japonica Group]|uniref:Os02g0648300 protein n=1 Tax=Oryza sativa subsp. japonica TaxID=39947 RepID=Q0DZ44_ORYSJ|nr:Os02g0648300 [Oryza sativa Japonica Group]|eukprot:NP_001047580.2 Os02g0648300 [Oryza sativa Japonica Group]